MSSDHRYLHAQWPAPGHVRALVTTRREGISQGPFASFNMGLYSGDDQEDVWMNRRQIARDFRLSGSPQWLKQVHGTEVIEAESSGEEQEADASVGRSPGVVCAVLAADCLPVLFCDRSGTTVAAAHAGWKGLAAGVLEATVNAMGVNPAELLAWMGPAISQPYFEVGPEVREAFVKVNPTSSRAFRAGKDDRWHGDLYELARIRLHQMGVAGVYGGEFCTVSQPDLFYSYRRDGKQSGRMAALIWMEDK